MNSAESHSNPPECFKLKSSLWSSIEDVRSKTTPPPTAVSQHGTNKQQLSKLKFVVSQKKSKTEIFLPLFQRSSVIRSEISWVYQRCTINTSIWSIMSNATCSIDTSGVLLPLLQRMWWDAFVVALRFLFANFYFNLQHYMRMKPKKFSIWNVPFCLHFLWEFILCLCCCSLSPGTPITNFRLSDISQSC